MRRSNEPLAWALFSAGGMVAAIVMPGLIVVTGFLVPAEQVAFSRLEAVLLHPLGRIALFALAVLVFFHWAHRFRHILADLGLRAADRVLAITCYAVALAGTVWAGTVAFG
jgi:fumarate reductase subunit D